MCGIVAVSGSREALPLILDGLEKLEYRGYDSAGIAIVNSDNLDNTKVECQKAQGKLKNLVDIVTKTKMPGTVGIGHIRWATHGKPEVKNAHPHLDESGKIAVVQNGIIENYSDIRANLIEEGVEFLSDTDTEVIPHLIAKELNTLKKLNLDNTGSTLLVAVRNILSDLEGSYALAVVWADAPDALVVVRNQTPLVIGLGEGEFLCASDTPAIESFTKTILPMENGEIGLLTPLGIELYDENNNRQHRNPQLLKGHEHIVDKKNFRHFMLKEIYEQPETANAWISRYLNQTNNSYQINYPFETDFLKSIDRIQILACGTSRHAALVGSYLLEQFSGIPTSVFYASEFRYSPPPILPNTLTIGVTQSGETADTLAALDMEYRRRKALGDPNYLHNFIGITNRTESSLSRQIASIIDINAGIEVGVAATKTFLGQLLSFYGLALTFARIKNIRTYKEINSLAHNLNNLPTLLSNLLLEHNKLAKELAPNFSQIKDVIFLGRGINYPIALEGALKLKEISYIHAAGYPAGEMKHGPIALLDKKVPVVSIATPGSVFEKVISNAEEAKARDSFLIGVAPKSAATEVFDFLFPIPEIDEWVSPLLTVLPMQLMSYHIAAHKGLDIDQPRNLAKSVTVE
tara:strand:+ start:32879 stop:34777 length:1899 start_codon:yes stop_codon:yes gene_type:complete